MKTFPLPNALRRLLALTVCATLLGAAPARAQHDAVTDASAASSAALSLPVAVVASTGFVVLGGAAVLTVVAVQASATGTVWVLERASDGTRVVLRFSGRMARGAAIATGARVIGLLRTDLDDSTPTGSGLWFSPQASGCVTAP